MSKFVYCRVSSNKQHEDRQILALKKLKIPQERIFIDKLSGKDTNRPELQRLMNTIKEGDTIIVESISRFARNIRDLLSLVDQLISKGVEFISQKERIDTTTPSGKFMLTVFGAFAELEREYILQRQAEGIAAAKARGVRFGRPRKEIPPNFGELVQKWESKILSKPELLKECRMSGSTFDRRLREHRAAKSKIKNTSKTILFDDKSA